MTKQMAEFLATMMYTAEPCRICGKIIKSSDVKNAVFAGYSQNNETRTAHQKCWLNYHDRNGKPHPSWKYQ